MWELSQHQKRYRYLYLKDVLDFYELDEKLKARKKEQAKRLPRGAAGISYGNPAHLVDAAQCIKLAWGTILDRQKRMRSTSPNY